MEHHSSFDSFEMQVTAAAQGFLRTAAGWGMFLSIIGFLFLALGLLGALGMIATGSMLDSTPGMPFSGTALGVTMLFFVIIMFIPILYLFKFSTSTRQAISNNSTDEITKAFGNLRSYFAWSGILTIIYIVVYIAFVGMAISAGIGAASAM